LFVLNVDTIIEEWSWSYGSWIYSDLCNQCISTTDVVIAWGKRTTTLNRRRIMFRNRSRN